MPFSRNVRTITLKYEDLNDDGVQDMIQTVSEETFWFKAGTAEDVIWADESARQVAIDPESQQEATSRQEYF